MKIKDREFEPFVGREEIEAEVARVASEISRDYAGRRPVLCPVLTGSFVFAADLARRLTVEAEVSFVGYKSYEGTRSSGEVRAVLPFSPRVEGRDVIIVEDIIDTGLTMEVMLSDLAEMRPASVRVCSLFFKPESCTRNVRPDYKGFDIGNEFIVGYGLDYDGQGRTLPDLWVEAPGE